MPDRRSIALTLSIAALGACAHTGTSHEATASASPAPSPAPTLAGPVDPAEAGTPIGTAPPDFPAADSAHFVNGTPVTLASFRGDVVLVESWHRL